MQTINNHVTNNVQPTVESVAAALFAAYMGNSNSRDANMVENVASYALRDAAIFMEVLKGINR